MGGGKSSSSYSLARHILQAEARAEARRPLRVIAVSKRGPWAPIDPRRMTLSEAAEHLVVVEASSPEDLSGLDVVSITAGQEKHPLYENAETRRRSRMLG